MILLSLFFCSKFSIINYMKKYYWAVSYFFDKDTSVQSHYDIDIEKETRDALFTLIVSMFVVGGMVGALVGGTVADKLGRKRGLILSAVILIRVLLNFSIICLIN